jgi:peptidoglycan/LPS O-acetylase OafA/YrhL
MQTSSTTIRPPSTLTINRNRIEEIDFLKAVAIIGVLIMHCFPLSTLYNVGAPFHLHQSVPVFFVLAGYTYAQTLNNNVMDAYRWSRIKKHMRRFVMPAVIVITIQDLFVFYRGDLTLGQFIESFRIGGYGPGSYFIPVYIQHLAIFPFILYAIKAGKSRPSLTLIGLFAISILLDWACTLTLDGVTYRLLYVRYIFAAVIGAYLYLYGLNYRLMLPLAIFGSAYVVGVNYLNLEPRIFIRGWPHEHAPAYLYTCFLIMLGWKYLPSWAEKLRYIGQYSYYIYLAQMVVFWRIYILLGIN